MPLDLPEYQKLQRELCAGFNTFNTRSVLCHVLLPQSFAIHLGVKEYRGGEHLREALIGRDGDGEEQVRPGLRSYDGTYTELTLTWRGIELRVQTATLEGDWVALITPVTGQLKPARLIVELGVLWGKPGTSERIGESLVASAPGSRLEVFATTTPVHEPLVRSTGPYLALDLSEPVGLSTGSPRPLEAISTHLMRARAQHEATLEQYGELREVYTAMQTCMAWDTIYDPAGDRVISPVSRRWNTFQGGWVLFCWDTYFAAYMASLDSKAVAYANAVEITREKTERGFVPNVSNSHGFKSKDRSQPPVGSMVVRELYRKFRDRWLIEMLFDDLLTWNRWWWNHRKLGELLAWGSNVYAPTCGNEWESPERGVGRRFGAALESGLDNSPMYDDARFDPDRELLLLHDVGLNGLYVMDCVALADLAQVLEQREAASELRERGDRISQAMESLWDESRGIYLNRHTDTQTPSSRISPTNLYAFLTGSVAESRSERILKQHFYDDSELWGRFAMPSIARSDPAFKDQSYWRGRIWAPMNFLVYLGLRRQGLTGAAADLARKSAELLLGEWREHGHVCEHYDADTGNGATAPGASGADRFYHWGGLLGLIALIEAGHVPGWEAPL